MVNPGLTCWPPLEETPKANAFGVIAGRYDYGLIAAVVIELYIKCDLLDADFLHLPATGDVQTFE